MICEICNSEFFNRRKAKTCSIECRQIRRKNLNYPNVKARRHKIKIKAVEYKGGKCVLCGYAKCKEGLDFHQSSRLSGSYKELYEFLKQRNK